MWLIQHQQRRGRRGSCGSHALPQAARARQDEEEWETEDGEEIVGGHEEAEPEEQDALNDSVNLP